MKFRLIVFDVDGTLIPSDKPMSCDVSVTLRHFENLGIRIALSSGKHFQYIEGVARDLGIKRPIIIAENGCIIVDVVYNKEVWLTKRTPEIREIREKILSKFSDFTREQPNKVEFTVFPKTVALLPEIISYARELNNQYGNRIHMYEYAGYLDILPASIDKGAGLAEIKRMYGFKKEEVAAIGDGENDIPMFKEAGLSLIVGTQISYPDAMSFHTIEEALDFLKKNMKQSSKQ